MSKRITKAVRAAFDEQIATMKRNEEASGLWCICGHSSPTHDNGFTCQSVACDCLSFRPSNADTRTDEPPAPRAGGWSAVKRAANMIDIVDNEGLIASVSRWRSGVAGTEREADELANKILTEHNQHATLIEQRERLLQLLRPVTSPTACYCAVMKGEKCWHCEARELLATIEREGEASR